MKQPITLWLISLPELSDTPFPRYVAYDNESDALFFSGANFPDSSVDRVRKGTFVFDEVCERCSGAGVVQTTFPDGPNGSTPCPDCTRPQRALSETNGDQTVTETARLFGQTS